jgi:hypothetical protein
MGLNHIVDVVWPLALATVAIAFVATAIVQLLKELLPIRRKFQRSFLATWFTKRLNERGNRISRPDLMQAESDLIHLATGGDRNAFYDLETPQLCGQMNSAAQIALAYPDRHPHLLRFLAPEADEGDVKTVVTVTPKFSARRGSEPSPQEEPEMNELLDARNRVTHHLQRSIDALQISMSFRWKLILQCAVYAICLIASLFTILVTKGPTPYSPVEIILVAVVAGFLSPVISDLVGVVQKLRRP